MSVRIISQLQRRTDSYSSESAPSKFAIWEKETIEAVEGNIQEPGTERFATIVPRPVIHVLLSCHGRRVAVIQGSPCGPPSGATTATARCSPIQHRPGLVLPKFHDVTLSDIVDAPSRPVPSSIHLVTAATTSLVACTSSDVGAPNN
jgi:hypothetical protein